jgi:hypothetical protein
MTTKLKIDIQDLDITWIPSTNYYLTVEEGFVQTVGGSGLINPTQVLNFTTPALPAISQTVPGNAATNISATTVRLIFDRETIFKQTGNIYLYRDSTPSDVLVSTIPMNDAKVTVSNNEISINLLGLLDSFQTYYILLDNGIINDVFNFNNQSIVNENTFRFTTAGLAITSLSPANNSTDVSTNQLVITFNNNIVKNTGNIYIYEAATFSNVLVSTISVNDSRVTISAGNRLNIDISNLLAFGKIYFVTTDSGIVRNSVNQYNFLGITNNTDFKFTREIFANNASGVVNYNVNTSVLLNSAPTIRTAQATNLQDRAVVIPSTTNNISLFSSTNNISEATLTNTLNVRSQEQNLTGLFIKPDGTKLWTIGTGQDRIQEYDLVTPWNLSTARLNTAKLDILTQETDPTSLFFSADGTKVYVIGNQNDRVYQYDLSTAWNLLTAAYNNKFFSIASQTTTPGGIYFKPDGTRFWISSTATSGRLNEYSMSTPWDIATSSFTGKFDDFISNSSIYFKDDGTSMLHVDNNGIYQIPLAVAWDVASKISQVGLSVNVSRLSAVNISDAIFFPREGKIYATQVNTSTGLNSILEYTTVIETYGYNVESIYQLQFTGNRNQVNAALSSLNLLTATGYNSSFDLNYVFLRGLINETGYYTETKTQAVQISSTPVNEIVSNLNVVRTYSANQNNELFLSSAPANKIQILENDQSNPDYTVSFTANSGQLSAAVGSISTTLSSTVSFSGKKSAVNTWLRTASIHYWPDNGVSSNTTISFKLQKNTTDHVIQNITLNGTARSNADILSTITSTQTFGGLTFDWLIRSRYYVQDVLIVGGGGGGAKGGGGGGGQASEFSNLNVEYASYTATIGNGGAGALAAAPLNASSGAAGSSTSLVAGSQNLTAGGGAGGIGVYATAGNASGGAAGGSGSAGGSVIWNTYSSAIQGGGGGGAGSNQVGGNGVESQSFNGGNGRTSSISGTSTFYGGGGGGGAPFSGFYGTRLGGSGGGGAGRSDGAGQAGTANTGGGGGGSSAGGSAAGGAGGSGVIIIRYKQKP